MDALATIGAAKSAKASSGSIEGRLVRTLTWTDAFWMAAGVPPLVLFSMGGIANIAGHTAFLVWMVSMSMGFSQSFTYAEMAGMFGNKSGGASIYGAMAWVRYCKFIAPLSVWCNWFAWTPVLSLGCSIAAGYILNLLKPWTSPGDHQTVSWLSDLQGLCFRIPGVGTLNFNAKFAIGMIFMLLMFVIQHRGIATTAKGQKILAIFVLVPLLVVSLLPIAIGNIRAENFENVVPPSAPGATTSGSWNISGCTLVLGSMYMAAWTTYAFETAVCYTSELKDPKKDTFKAIFSSGLLCCVFFFVVPFSFQGVLGDDLLAPGITDGSGIAMALGNMAGGKDLFTTGFVILMILGVFLAIMTAMAGSSRTLYQGSTDGLLPKYLSTVNTHGAPTGAMWTDFVFNMFLLALASDSDGYNRVLAISNVGYLLFNFLNLNAGWIHRIDSAHLPRAFKAPTFVIALNTMLSFINALFLGAGAKVYSPNALWSGLLFASLIFPLFAYRHYIQDGGEFPEEAMQELGLKDGTLGERKAGILPYLVLLAGAAVTLWANWFFVT